MLPFLYIAFFSVTLTLHAQETASDTRKVLIVSVIADTADTLVPISKVEAGVALAFQLSSAYLIMPVDVRDSILRERGLVGLTNAQAAAELKADILLFVSTRRFVNLIRTELVMQYGAQYATTLRGVGYAAIRFQSDSTDAIVADPALLLAAQHALMDCVKNPILYGTVDSLFRARVAPTVVVGGVNVTSDVDTSKTPAWSLFKEQEVTSYHAVQTITEALSASGEMTLVDIETRDTMLTRANLYMIANNHGTTTRERGIFYAFGIEQIISGTCRFTTGGYVLTLTLGTIEKDGGSAVLRSVEDKFTKDTKQDWRNSFANLARKLVNPLPESK